MLQSEAGIDQDQVIFLNLFATAEGLDLITQKYPSVRLHNRKIEFLLSRCTLLPLASAAEQPTLTSQQDFLGHKLKLNTRRLRHRTIYVQKA